MKFCLTLFALAVSTAMVYGQGDYGAELDAIIESLLDEETEGIGTHTHTKVSATYDFKLISTRYTNFCYVLYLKNIFFSPKVPPTDLVSAQQSGGCRCLESLDVWAKTSTLLHAGTFRRHDLEILLTTGQKLVFQLRGIPSRGRSKLWTFNIYNPSSPSPMMPCMSVYDIESIAIDAVSSDGWNVNSIVTIFEDSYNHTFTGSIDRGINAWVDHGDPQYPQSERVELTVVGHN